MLNNNGLKISRIAEMSQEEMNRRVLEISELKNDLSIQIDQLVVSMINMEEEAFERILASLILRHSFEKTITEIVYPFLEKIGILWQTQNITPAHEHFISNLIRQKIIVAIDGLPIPPRVSRKIVLFLPEGELHELGLLFFHYICRKSGLRTYYIGQNTPHEDLVNVVRTHEPEMMLTSITSTSSVPVDEYFDLLSKDFPHATIFVSGFQVGRYKGLKIKNIQTFTSALDLKQYI
jgi:methanogenic corrinoid protein MtbC1